MTFQKGDIVITNTGLCRVVDGILDDGFYEIGERVDWFEKHESDLTLVCKYGNREDVDTQLNEKEFTDKLGYYFEYRAMGQSAIIEVVAVRDYDGYGKVISINEFDQKMNYHSSYAVKFLPFYCFYFLGTTKPESYEKALYILNKTITLESIK